jgi:replicative DNA helicase
MSSRNDSSFSPPHSIEAEKAVLGSVLRDSEALNLIADKVRAEFFFLDIHQHIFEAMASLYHHNEPTDIVSVAERIKRNGHESDQLGPSYLVELTEVAPLAQNIEHHAKIVRDYYYIRKIISTCQSTIRKAMNHEGEVAQFVEDVEKEFLAVSNANERAGIATMLDVLEETLEDIERRIACDTGMTGVPSQFVDLDAVTGGWQRSDLVILAARPAMGKTAFALNVIMNAIKSGKSVAVFSLEMSKAQLMTRIIAAEARLDSTKLRKGDLTDEEQDRLMQGVGSLSKMEAMLGIDDTPGISLLDLRSKCRRFQKERHGLDMVVIDYLQLMTASGSTRYDSREREIAEISKGLKNLAKELNIPVIALAQLNRGPDSRTDKIPKLSDLRESGSMEQDADMIMFLYRDEYYNPNSEDAGKCLVKIAKNRHGSLEDVMLAFAPQFMKFSNLAK